MSTSPAKPLVWVASSKKDLGKMPDEVQDVFGFALYQAQIGKKSSMAKPLKGFGSAAVIEVVEDWMGDVFRAVYTVKFANAVYVLHCFQNEVVQGHRNAKTRFGPDPRTFQSGGSPRERYQAMTKIHEGSTNVYADLGYADASAMLVKAQLADAIATVMKRRRLTQAAAAGLFAMPQPKVSAMLRGQFRGISEEKMMRCLVALGQSVKIVVKPAPKDQVAELSVAA